MANNSNISSRSLTALFDYVTSGFVVIPRATTPSSFNAGNAAYAYWRGRFYERTPGYTGSTRDNTKAFRDQSGNAFVAGNFPVVNIPFHVISQGAITPPTNPREGDAYIVGNAGAGTWSGQANKIAVWNAWSEWDYIDAPEGWSVRNRADNSYWVRITNGTWQRGFGTENIAAASINPTQLANPGYIPVKSVVRSPAGLSAQNGDIYLISNNPTGTFRTRPNQLAYRLNNAWTYGGQPEPGTTVRDANTGTTRAWNGTSWATEGVDNPLILFRFNAASPASTNPTGTQTGVKSRVIWSLNIPADVSVLEVELGEHGARGIQYSDRRIGNVNEGYWWFDLKVGNDIIRTEGASAIASGIFIANTDRLVPTDSGRNGGIGTTPTVFGEGRTQIIRLADYNSRTLSLEISARRNRVFNPGAVQMFIRNITELSGHTTIKGYKT